MTTMKNLVKTMFMNILTAGIFTFAFTACSDEIDNMSDNRLRPSDRPLRLRYRFQYGG